jgi:hypothetical protein
LLDQDCDLHLFADGSEEGFAAVGYLAFIADNGEKTTAFIMGKNRLAPRRQISIPKLELNGAVMSTRLAQTLVKELTSLKLQKLFLWSDSTSTLAWILNESRRYETFVANRISEIQDSLVSPGLSHLSPVWKHVPGKLNPADIGTRSISVAEFEDRRDEWYNGPEFLRHDESMWPSRVVRPEEEDQSAVKSTIVTVAIQLDDPELCEAKDLEDLISRTLSNRPEQFAGRTLVQQRRDIELFWVKRTQQHYLASEYKRVVEQKQPVIFKHGLLRFQQVFLDRDVLRLMGRLQHASVPYHQKHPIVLPGDSKIAKLIIEKSHQAVNHLGVSYVKEYIRRRYHLTQLNANVRRVIQACIRCRELKPKPLSSPFGPYHWSRFNKKNQKHAFQFVGVDLFGPYVVKIGQRSEEKRYGVIFLCKVTRAVHLEMARSLTSESLIMTLDRMVARRGCPETIICDNGGNFQGLSNELRRLIEEHSDTIIQDQARKGIDFRFNPPGSPHWGGSYERSIKTVKLCLVDSISGVACLTEDVLETALVQAEHILNNRPLEFDDEGVAITPMQLIAPMGNNSGVFHLQGKESTFKAWRQVNQAISCFWKRWRRLYLSNLSMKAVDGNGQHAKLAVGDRVLLKDLNDMLNQWDYGTVKEVYVGIDGHPRAALVETRKGLLYRGLNRISMLEVSD